MDTGKIDTLNRFAVASGIDGIVILAPPRTAITDDEALILAAYLVTMVIDGKDRFASVLHAVENA